jgi:single-strand DNA-binding protein
MSFNKVILSGRLTANPEIKANNMGLLICNFSLAVNEYVKGNEYTSFVNCIAFGKTAEILQQHVTKGSLIGVEGSLRQSRWEDQSGAKRSRIEVIVARIEIFEWKRNDSNDSSGSFNQNAKQNPQKAAPQEDSPSYYGEEADFIEDDSEIPF